ncbi:hypothetical protein N0V82_009102 [Gnomoniopsis sp. IMI 355080]|nr:hypothetical protein N0V82_009102 [Gnomoniopsis sp. IMI 355080]
MSTAVEHVHLDAPSLTLPPSPSSSRIPDKRDADVNISTHVDPPGRRTTWIRYRTELRDGLTGELLRRIDSDTKKGRMDDTYSEGPILELITRYDTRDSKDARDAILSQEGSWLGQSSASAPSYNLRIRSMAIINALQSVVEYYPGQNLSGNTVEVPWPYAILVHHYDQLKDFKSKCQSKGVSELCVREKNAPEHIDHLIEFLDENIMERVIAEKSRLRRGFYTFEDIWVAYKPGRTVADLTDEDKWQPYVISEVTGGIFAKPTMPWRIRGWALTFDGRYVGRYERTMNISRRDGERDLTNDTRFVDDETDIDKGVLAENVAYGEMWYKLLEKQCRNHKGNSLEFPYNEIEGLVMADLETYFEQTGQRPDLLENTDCRKWSSDCTCDVCQKRALEGPRKVKSPFDDYNEIVPAERKTLIPHMYLLCPSSMRGFVFKLRTWQSIAEYTKRPLMILTSADVGTNPTIVEASLTNKFKTARRWGAVLLIDEADVFMERRGTADLERNSLVAAFLRALEYYDGILFLTTNRVGSFDDAFISRIHVQLFYKDFTDEDRQKVWMTFVDKLNRERGKYIRVTMDAKDYIRGTEIRAVQWNGREIRNAFQTAVSLAEYDDDKDEEGKIMLTDEHLRAVVELSKNFKDYLKDLHKADEDKRALRRYERLDA